MVLGIQTHWEVSLFRICVMQEKNTILEFLDSMRLITLGTSGGYAYREECLRRDALPIEIVSVRGVFTEYEISTILRVINPKVKQCYKNAFLLSSLFPGRVEYCEGLYTDYAFEHAFNGSVFMSGGHKHDKIN